MQVKTCLECIFYLDGATQKIEVMQGEIDTLVMERDLYREQSGIYQEATKKAEKQIKKQKRGKTWLGVGLGLTGAAAFIGGVALGKNVK
jgi:hypothetical protein